MVNYDINCNQIEITLASVSQWGATTGESGHVGGGEDGRYECGGKGGEEGEE